MNKRHSLATSERHRLESKLNKVLMSEESVLFAFLHGSFVDHDLTFGDIDIAVYFVDDPTNPVAAILDLKEILEGEIKYAYEVDVQILNNASLAFQFHASQGTVLGCKDSNAVDDFRQKTWLRYWDYEPFMRQSLTYLLEP